MNLKFSKSNIIKYLIIAIEIIIFVALIFTVNALSKLINSNTNQTNVTFREIKISESNITVDYSTYDQGHLVATITSNENLAIEYKIDSGTWATYTTPVEIPLECTIYARLANGTFKYPTTTKQVVKVKARIGNVYYTSLANAIASCSSSAGTTSTQIDLLCDNAEIISVADGKNIIINTNEKTLTSLNNTITNAGTLRIIGSGSIISTGVNKNAIVNTGTLNIGLSEQTASNTSTPIIMAEGNGIYNPAGTFNFYSGAIKGKINAIAGIAPTTPDTYMLMYNMENSNYEVATLGKNPVATSTISSVTKNHLSVQAAIDCSRQSVSTVTLMQTPITESVTVASGQKITLNTNGKTLKASSTNTIVNNGELVITGNGTIQNSKTGTQVSATESEENTIINSAKLTINNGTVISNKIASTVKNTTATAELTVSGGRIENTSGNGYAISNHTEGSTTTITGGVIKSAYRTIYAGGVNATGTINISGGEITAEGTTDTYINPDITQRYITCVRILGGEVNITGGTFNARQGTSTIDDVRAMHVIDGDVTIGGNAIINSDNFGILTSSNGTTTTINGGTINARVGIHVNDSDVVINDVTINAIYHGINNEDTGTVIVNGGNITATGEGSAGIYNKTTGTVHIKSGSVTGETYGVLGDSTGTIIIGDSSTTPPSKTIPVIVGGTVGVSGASATVQFNDGIVKGVTKPITVSTVQIPANYSIFSGMENISGVNYETAILDLTTAKVATSTTAGVTKDHLSVQAAIDCSKQLMSTITLIKTPITESVTVASGQKITLDTNGKTLKASTTNTIVNNGELVITGNGTIQNSKTGTQVSQTESTENTIINNAKLTINNGTVISNKRASVVKNITASAELTVSGGRIENTSGYEYAISNHTEGATTTITGGTIKSAYRTIYAGGVAADHPGTINISGGNIIAEGTADTDSNLEYITCIRILAGEVNITGGIFTATTGASSVADVRAIYVNNGNVTIGGNTVINSSNFGVLTSSSGNTTTITGGTINARVGIHVNDSDVVINDVTINAIYHGINNEDTGTVIVNGGNITATGEGSAGIYNKTTGTVHIKSGSVTGGTYGVLGDSTGTIIIGDSSTTPPSKTIPVIVGGTVGVSGASATVQFNDGIVKGVTKPITVPTVQIPANYSIFSGMENISGVNYETAILDLTTAKVATSTTAGVTKDHLSVQAAIDCSKQLMSTITLIKTPITESVTVASGQKITLDTNGKTLKASTTNTIVNNGELVITGNGIIQNSKTGTQVSQTESTENTIINNAKLTINNGTVISNKRASVVKNIAASAELTVSGGRIENTSGYEYAISNHTEGSTTTITGGTIKSAYRTIYAGGVLTQTGVINISGGNIIAEGTADTDSNLEYITCIRILAGMVNITGGTFIATTGASSIVDVRAIYVSDGNVNIGGNAVINSDNYGVLTSSNGNTTTITGGTINARVGIHVNDSNVVINDVTINAIYHGINNEDTGTVTVNGGNITATGEGSAGIYNKTTGTVHIKSGSVTGGAYGVLGDSTGTIIIGDSSTTPPSRTIPVIVGGTVGVSGASATVEFDDGIIKGTLKPITVPTVQVPANYSIFSGMENISGVNYETATIRLTSEIVVTSLVAGVTKNHMSIQDAIDCSKLLTAVITLIKPTVTENVVTPVGQSITLDVNGKTLTSTSGKTIINNGNLAITNFGNINSTDVVIENAGTGTVTTSNATLTSTSSQALYNSSTGTIIVNSGTINGTSTTTVIRNNGAGTITVQGGTINSNGYGIYNVSTGNINITGGTINTVNYGVNSIGGPISITGGRIISSEAQGVRLENASVVVGTNETTPVVRTDLPSIRGYTYGIQRISGTTQTIDYYDGIIKGINGAIEGQVNGVPANYSILHSNDGTYDSATLGPSTTVKATTTIAGVIRNHSSAQSGINYAKTNAAVVKLEADTITENIIIGAGQNIELNTNGKTLNSSSGSTITNNGTLNITGNGYINSTAITVHNKGTGTATITNGTLKSTGSITLYNATTGNIVVNGGTIQGRGLTNVIRNISTGNITINGGDISSDKYGILNYSTGTINVNAGTITAPNYGIYGNEGTVNITDGTITTGAVTIDDTLITTEGALGVSMTSGTLIITGGTVESTTAVAINITTGTGIIGNPEAPINPLTPIIIGGIYGVRKTDISTGNIQFYDGKISGKTAALVPDTVQKPENYSLMYKKEGLYEVVTLGLTTGIKATSTIAGVIKNHATVQDAITYGGTNSTTVKLIPTTVTENITIEAGQNIVLDTNGKTLNSTSGTTVTNNGTLNITGNGYINSTAVTVYNKGTGTATITSGTLKSTGSITIYNITTGNIVVNGGTIQGRGATNVISNVSTGTIIINGGDISSDKYGILNYSSGTLNINGGTITAPDYGIKSVDGTVTMSGGTITGGDVTIDGTLITAVGGYGASILAGTFTITDGTIESTTAIAINITTGTGIIGNPEAPINPLTPTIIGGTYGVRKTDTSTGNIQFYDGKISGKTAALTLSTIQKPENYSLMYKREGLYEVVTLGLTTGIKATSTIAGVIKNHATVQDAITYGGTNSTTVKLIPTTVTENITIATGQNLVLDTNGKTLNSTSGTTVTNNGTLEITGTGTGGINSTAIVVENAGTGTVTITNGTLTSSGSHVLYNGSSGIINVNGGIVTGNSVNSVIRNNDTGTININAGLITSAGYGLYNGSTGIMNIKGGIIQTVNYGVNGVAGTIRIRAGSITSSTAQGVRLENAALVVGTLESPLSVVPDVPYITGETYGIARVSPGTGTFQYYDGTIKSKGTVISADITAQSSNYSIVYSTDGTYDIATLAPTSSVMATSTIAGVIKNHTIVQNAIAFGKTSATTVKLMAATITENITIAAGQNIVLDTNEKTLNSTSGTTVTNNGNLNITGNGYINSVSVTVNNKGTGTITMTNGTLKSTSSVTLRNATTGTIVVNGGTVQGRGLTNAVTNVTTGTITINGGDISSNKYGILNNSTGTLNINGGTITAPDYGIKSVDGTVTMSGGTITAGDVTIDNTLITAVGGYGASILAGTFTITDGTVESTTAIAINITTGTVIIGDPELPVSIQNPIIIGGTYGVRKTDATTGTLEYYDGVITANTGKTISYSGIVEKPQGCTITITTANGRDTCKLM